MTVSMVTGIQLEIPLTEMPRVREVQVDGDPGSEAPPEAEGSGVGVARPEPSEVKRVTVTVGPEDAPDAPGAVMIVDQEPGLPSGTVTVRTTVAVLSGPSGMVTVTTDPAGGPDACGTVDVEVGTSDDSGRVRVMSEPGLPLPAGMVRVTRAPLGTTEVGTGPEAPLDGLGTVTVTTGTVTVLRGPVGNSVSVMVRVRGATGPDVPWPPGKRVAEDVHVEESEPKASVAAVDESEEPEGEPRAPGSPEVTVTVKTEAAMAVWVDRGTVTITAPPTVVVLVQGASSTTSSLQNV